MSKIDEIESSKLQSRISDLEHQLSSSGASAGSSTSMLVEILNDAKRQLNSLQMKEQSHNDEERRKADAQLVAVVHLVTQETALNQRERQQYGAFIQKEFFTKNDFITLEDFYASAWDRLTDGGKAQMSHRVWEGVRRDEYDFSELPENVKEKEAKRLYDQITMRKPPTEILNIPKQDRDDFLREWGVGNHSKSYEILERSVFANNIALSANPISSVSVEIANGSEALKTSQSEKDVPKQCGTKTEDSLGVSEFGLDDLKLADNGLKPPLSGLPPASGGKSPMIR